MKLRFGECVLDTEARQLSRRGREVRLSPKAFELLCLLAESRGKALSKAQLHAHIWPATFVSDDSLARLVTEIRHGIGDSARDPRQVRTVYGFGYAFTDVADTVRDDDEPRAAPGRRCWLRWEGREVQVRKAETIIGRDPDVDVPLESPRISRRHARIVVEGPVVRIEDLGSKNGTYLQGRRITTPTPLAHGDEIRIGPFLLKFRASPPTALTETEGDSN